MRKINFKTIPALILVILFCSSFLIPDQTAVPANKAWTKTKYIIGIGDKIEIVTNGEISPIENIKCNPDGVLNRIDLQKQFGVIKTSNFGCIIGKIGEKGTPFLIGANLTIISENKGELYLGINDNNLKDNSGEFLSIVTITVNTTIPAK